MTFNDTPLSNYARYRVTFHCFLHDKWKERYFTYTICTAMGERKAIVWAALVHTAKNPDRSIYDVNVEFLGESMPEGTDYIDRMEG